MTSETTPATIEASGIDHETDGTDTADGRTTRRDRNRDAVLDAVLELFTEDNLTPSPDDVARRSGVSLRSVYRYVADADDLIRAAIDRHVARIEPLSEITDIGQGPFEARVDRFLDSRLRLYEAIAPTAPASRVRAATNTMIREQLERGRSLLRDQTAAQFAPELSVLDGKSRDAMLAAADALTQIETIDLYRHHRKLSPNATRALLRLALVALLTPS